MKQFNSKKLVIGLITLILVSVGLIFIMQRSMAEDEKQEIGVEVNKIAPDFTLMNLEGEEVSLSDYRGKNVLLHFWLTTCPICEEEKPYLDEFHNKNEDVVVLAVSVAEPKARVKEYMKSGGYQIPTLLDEAAEIAIKYNVGGVPANFFIDQEGRIKHIENGKATKEQLNKLKQGLF
ncbi:TlpA family protein disulfide reductase [Natroniella sp. ANB-PHB2]|uniref:TlpA family protein disulfide reductase n=1 Tax=Natroniella sp. ANB-PHB2 TaxID=3384444 RepID=UPI0038D4CAD4